MGYHEIWTFDGGVDGLSPGRWLAHVDNISLGEIQGRGTTEEEAVADLKRQLAEKVPQAPWYQGLPAVRKQ